MKKGILYGVGAGSGDPELMTLKAVRIIREADIVALPGTDAKKSAAYRIAVQSVPELAQKKLLAIHMPMTRDEALLRESHERGARLLKDCLDEGMSVAYLALGDPSVYCSFSYLQRILEHDGYDVRLLSGVTSFCAAAARLGIPLVTDDEPMYVLPDGAKQVTFENEGTYVLMKTSDMTDLKRRLKEAGLNVSAVERCGMEGERVFNSADEIPDDAGYFTLVIAKNDKKWGCCV